MSQDEKTKSQIVTGSIQIGNAINKGYLLSCVIIRSGGAGTVSFYDGTSASGTEKYRMTIPNTAGDCRSSSDLSIYFPNGCYCAVTNAIAVVEYNGF
jgi:hypothetical protein